MVQQLVRVDKAETSIIVVDGLTNPTAFALGYGVSSLKEARGSTRIDTEFHIAMKMIVKVGDVYYLMFKDQDTTHPFSDPECTTIRNKPQPPPLELPLGYFKRGGPSVNRQESDDISSIHVSILVLEAK
ncbi:hypothetical protein Ancab_035938 [Ancistrocladus abbreviatus]